MSKQSEALSPWGMTPAQQARIYPLAASFDVTMDIPGSKSFTNRALLLAALAHGKSILRAPLFSDDSYWCVDALQKLGVGIRADKEKNVIEIDGIGDAFLRMMEGADLPYIGSAGTIARFLPGLIAAKGEGEIVLTSSDQLARRPVSDMIEGLRQLGADIAMPDSGSFPMTIQGGTLQGGDVTISGKTSSQFISGLLLCAPLAKKAVRISIPDYTVQGDYVHITLDLMKEFGVDVKHNEALTEFVVEPQNYTGRDIQLEADASTSTYFFALAAATKSKITITNLNPDTRQPDYKFIDHLKSMGCIVNEDNGVVSLQGPEKLSGHHLFDFNPCSDSTPALAAIAPFADGPVEVRNVEHIRAHESDRISVLHDTLKDAGVAVTEYPDGLAIMPTEGAPTEVTVNPHDDHRMAMSFAVMAAAGNGAVILDPACVSKTCPDFFELIKPLGVQSEISD